MKKLIAVGVWLNLLLSLVEMIPGGKEPERDPPPPVVTSVAAPSVEEARPDESDRLPALPPTFCDAELR